MVKYFKNVKSYENLKEQYKKLLKINHPDNGGKVEVMQEINVEYDALFAIWKNRKETKTGEKVQETAESTRSEFYTQNGWKGSNHDWNRSLKEVAKIVRTYVKEKYSTCKFSVRTSYASMCQELHVEIKEFPTQMYKTADDLRKEGLRHHVKTTSYDGKPIEWDEYNEDISEMERKLRHNDLFTLDSWADEELIEAYAAALEKSAYHYGIKTEYFKNVLDDVNAFVNSYNYEDCDGMIDYFCVDFYFFGCGYDECKQVEKVARIEKEQTVPSTKEREQATQTEETSVNSYTYEVTEDTDTRNGEKIFLVKVAEKLNREEYITVNKYIKSLGGYYSKFKHAFLFKENPTEKLNVTITENATQAAEPIQGTKSAEETEKLKKEIVSYTITEDLHTKTNAKIWIVKPEKELNKSDFAEVKRKFATLQGYYSNFKHGFIFKYDPTETLQTG